MEAGREEREQLMRASSIQLDPGTGEENDSITVQPVASDKVNIWFEGSDGECAFEFTKAQLDKLYTVACEMMGWEPITDAMALQQRADAEHADWVRSEEEREGSN